MTDLLISKSGYVQIIEINRPPHNYFDRQLLSDIADALESADTDKHIRAHLLCANGKSFCVGARIVADQSSDPDAASNESHKVYEQALRIFRSKKPIVAALQGHVIGGGLGVAMAADFRVTTPETRFSANFTRLGFHPGFALTLTLPEVVGKTQAALMMLTGRQIKGDEAYRIGLCESLVAEDQLRATALQLAEEIASSSPLGVIATRATLRTGFTERVEAQLQRELAEQTWLCKTEDFAEGVRAIAERRPAQFQGR